MPDCAGFSLQTDEKPGKTVSFLTEIALNRVESKGGRTALGRFGDPGDECQRRGEHQGGQRSGQTRCYEQDILREARAALSEN